MNTSLILLKNKKTIFKILKIFSIICILCILIFFIYWIKKHTISEKFQSAVPSSNITIHNVTYADYLAKYKTYNLITDKQIYNIDSVTGTASSCRIWFANYDPAKNTILSPMMTSFPPSITTSIKDKPYKYTYDSNINCSMVHAGLLKPGVTASNVGIILLPSYNGQSFSTEQHHGITPISYNNPYRCYSFYSVNGYILYDFVSKYNNSTSTNTVVNVTLTGDSSFATTETTWGLQRVWGGGDVDKYYTVDSYLPRAAVHAGFINDKETKTVSIKLIGQNSNFTSSTAYNITTLPFNKPIMRFSLLQHQLQQL